MTFTGSVYDKTTGLQYMNARFYQPATGRFLSQDTYSGNAYEPWTQHLYSYVGNNPTNMVDPTGHEAEEAGMTGGQIGHLILDAIGFISLIPTPVTLAIGIAANAANAAWYAAEGDYGNAALNAAACIPVAGQAAKMAKAGVEAFELTTKGPSAAFKLSSTAMQEGKGAIEVVKSLPNANNAVKWGMWNDLDKILHKGKQYAIVDGRYYTREAIDRMTPQNYGIAAGGYPARGIPTSVVSDVIENGTFRTTRVKNEIRTIYELEGVRVVTAEKGKIVITAYKY